MGALFSSLAHREPKGIFSHNAIEGDGGEVPVRMFFVIVGDDDSDYCAEGALIGMSEEGGGRGRMRRA